MCYAVPEVGAPGAEAEADRFAKFTILADPAPLWRRAAEELAKHAAQVGALK